MWWPFFVDVTYIPETLSAGVDTSTVTCGGGSVVQFVHFQCVFTVKAQLSLPLEVNMMLNEKLYSTEDKDLTVSHHY